MTEPEATEKYGKDNLKIYKTSVGYCPLIMRNRQKAEMTSISPGFVSLQFRAMSCAMLDEDHKSPTSYKLVCVGKEEKVVGLHLIGDGSDEMLQGCKWLTTSVLPQYTLMLILSLLFQSVSLSRWVLQRQTSTTVSLSVGSFFIAK